MVDHSGRGADDQGAELPLTVVDGTELDADRHLAELEALHRMARDTLQGHPFELYRRTSSTLRLSRDSESPDALSTQVGSDDGLALRTVGADGRVTFCATSGSGAPSLAWLIERSSAAHPILIEGAAWDRGDPFRMDRERALRLPSPAEIRTWMSDAATHLGAGGDAWVEAAITVESWVAGEGLRASRTRNRAWALARPARTERTEPTAPPLVVAGRRWEELRPDAWARLAADRITPRGPAAKRLPGRSAVLFAPECAAVLVQALVRILHADERTEGLPVGPAWRVSDDATDPAAVFGGSFDDARFPTRRRALADGDSIVGWMRGPGCHRRPSFRDAPAPMPANLVVDPGPQALPRSGLLVSSLRVHPLGPAAWVLEFDGALLNQGAPGPSVRAGRISIAPQDLLRRCVATYGDPESSHRGVRTPALLFDDLVPEAG